jgi:hypothetical protein
VDLEEEETKEQVNMDMVESGTNTVEVEKGSKLQSEGISRNLAAKITSLIRHLDKIINLKKIWKNNMLRKETWPSWVQMRETIRVSPMKWKIFLITNFQTFYVQTKAT